MLRGARDLLVLAVGLGGPQVAGAAVHVDSLSKLAPELAASFARAPDETVAVWVEFADKGERDPSDLAGRLGRAERALSPRARARRLRTGVRPLVDYRDLPVHPPYLDSLAARGGLPHGVSRWFNHAAVRIPARRLPELAGLRWAARIVPVERLGRSPDPEARPGAAPLRRARSTRAEVDYGQTLGQLEQLRIPALHDSGYVGSGLLVCVLDEGFNFFDEHEALRDHAIPPERQRDFVRGLPTVQDRGDGTLAHGTWVLGLIAGRKFGTYVGSAYGAEFALGRTEVRATETPQEMIYWAMGAEWADSLGADILCSSLGYFRFDDRGDDYAYADMDGRTTLVSRAAQIAASKGILVVNSVGNEGAGSWRYLIAPSDVHGDSVIAVGAVDALGVPATFSSFGPSADGRVKPDVAAWGIQSPVVSASGDPAAYGRLDGTSFATPLIAGLAACLMQARPSWTPREVSRAIRFTASRALDPDDRVGYGVPDGVAALNGGARPAGMAGPSLELAGPNPFSSDRGPARLRFGPFGGPAAASLEVYDLQGRRVRELWSGVVPCGIPVTVSWDGTDREGRRCRPGLYLAALEAAGARATRRLVCLR